MSKTITEALTTPAANITEAMQRQVSTRAGLNFDELRAANVARCGKIWPPTNEWTPTDWACAMAGEAGEACNEVKKLRRIAATPEQALIGDGHGADDRQWAADTSYRQGVNRVAMELADLIIYADLLAERMGIDLAAAVVAKFNKVSAENGCDVTLAQS